MTDETPRDPVHSRNSSEWNIDKLISEIKAKYEEKGLDEKWTLEGPLLTAVLNPISSKLQADYNVVRCEFVEGSRVVIRLTHLPTDEDVALKISRPFPQAIPAIAAEAKIVAGLDHPNLLKN